MARRAEHAVENTLYSGTAKVVGEAGAAEEQTGKVGGWQGHALHPHSVAAVRS